MKQFFDATDLPKLITWEEFEKKGYYVVPPPKRSVRPRPSLVRRRPGEGHPRLGPASRDTCAAKGLQTTTGKIEFVSTSLTRFEATGRVDPERPVMGPQYLPSWEGHHTDELYDKYPLQMISPHPRFSFHTMGDAKDTWINEVKDHRVLSRRPLLLDHAAEHARTPRPGASRTAT